MSAPFLVYVFLFLIPPSLRHPAEALAKAGDFPLCDAPRLKHDKALAKALATPPCDTPRLKHDKALAKALATPLRRSATETRQSFSKGACHPPCDTPRLKHAEDSAKAVATPPCNAPRLDRGVQL